MGIVRDQLTLGKYFRQVILYFPWSYHSISTPCASRITAATTGQYEAAARKGSVSPYCYN